MRASPSASDLVARDLTLEFPAGRTTCLLGRSGVGKTSCCAGWPACCRSAPRAQPVAYMAQSDLLLPWLSVLDNVLLGYRLRGDRAALAAAEARARALLARSRPGRPARRSSRLSSSGGMRQRAALARTLCEDRPVVLMDEPFAHLDAVTRLELQDLAARLLAGRTAVLVTHDPLEALRVGHQIRVLSGTPFIAGPAIEPAGVVPRDPADPALLGLHARLVAELRGLAP